MSDRRSTSIALVLLGLMCLLAIAQNAWYWNQLPDRVATHFNWEGQPDGWMSKNQATIVMVAFQVVFPWLIIAIASLSAVLPASMVNIPNAEYWMQPERRAMTLSLIASTISWIALGISVFLMAIHHLTFVSNRDGRPLDSSWFIGLLISFLVVVLGLVFGMSRRLRLRATDHPK